MKERPILFSAPMVRALLAGTKTQTRRALRPQPDIVKAGRITPEGGDGVVGRHTAQDQRRGRLGEVMRPPYGYAGDQLWVREAWRPKPDEQNRAYYRATDPGVSWKPSIHMPRWASRITLEVTYVRVERLQDISEADAQAEGSFTWAGEQDTPIRDLEEARIVYRDLWQSIAGPGSWDANPWVWAVSFRRITP